MTSPTATDPNAKRPYGMGADGKAVCVNAEPGTFGHECGKPATWIGTKANEHRACFCDDCKEHGHEGRQYGAWARIGPTETSWRFSPYENPTGYRTA